MRLQHAVSLADELAEQTLRRTGLWGSPPLPPRVEDLAERLGARLEFVELDIAGVLHTSEQRAIARVDNTCIRGRQNFTAAHELAHWLLVNPSLRTGVTTQVERAFDGDLERACDAIAAGLLMPRPWVTRWFRSSDHDLATVETLAEGARVSRPAALLRLHHVLGWTEPLLHWTRIEDDWILDDVVGLRAAQSGLIRSVYSTEFTLNMLARPALHLNAEIPLIIESEEQPVDADVRLFASGASALLRVSAIAARRGTRRRRRVFITSVPAL